MELFTVDRVSKSFRNGEEYTKAIDSLTFTIHEGDFIVLIGSNGSGKSTLLNLLAGTIQPDEGRILHRGKSISKSQQEHSAWISRVFQDPASGTASGLRVIENLRLASLRTSGRSFKIGMNRNFREEAIAQLKSLELNFKPDQVCSGLSGGQRQALTLLMAVWEKPELLLLDEPTAALDPKSSETICRLISQLTSDRKMATLMVSHNLLHAATMGNRLILMKEGKIVLDIRDEEKKKLSAADIHALFLKDPLPSQSSQ